MCWFVPGIKFKKKVCVPLVYCVDFYILYNLCSIFKRRIWGFKRSQTGISNGKVRWMDGLCATVKDPGESASRCSMGLAIVMEH